MNKEILVSLTTQDKARFQLDEVIWSNALVLSASQWKGGLGEGRWVTNLVPVPHRGYQPHMWPGHKASE